MSASSALARGRAAALALMVDACTIGRVVGTTTDEDLGEVVDVVEELYTGRCRIQQRSPNATPVEAGQQELRLLPFEVQLPISVVGLAEQDRITVTASAHDPDLPGTVLVVRDLGHKTHATARRVRCEEAT